MGPTSKADMVTDTFQSFMARDQLGSLVSLQAHLSAGSSFGWHYPVEEVGYTALLYTDS